MKPDGNAPDGALNGVNLAVQSPNDLAEFYVFNFGMWARQVGNAFHLTYSGSAATSILPLATASQPYVGPAPDRYWKIGITLPDLDYACRDLLAKGVPVSSPKQFLDIGYVVHFSDLEGFQM